jgi:hypothetical protein
MAGHNHARSFSNRRDPEVKIQALSSEQTKLEFLVSVLKASSEVNLSLPQPYCPLASARCSEVQTKTSAQK